MCNIIGTQVCVFSNSLRNFWARAELFEINVTDVSVQQKDTRSCLSLRYTQLLHVYGKAVGFQGGTSGKVSPCQCRRRKRRKFDPRAGKIPWSRKWRPTPVFLPRKFHGQKSLVGYSPWACKELDMMEQPSINM